MRRIIHIHASVCRWLPPLVIFLWMVGCTKPLKLPDVESKQLIVLLGELVANDTVTIRAGQSIPVAAGSSMKYTPPVQFRMRLSRNPGYIEYLDAFEDEWSRYLHTLRYSCGSKILPNQVYNITASHDKLPTAFCNVPIPPPFAASIIDTASVWVNGIHLLRVRIQIRDDADVPNFYVVEAVKKYLDIDGEFEFEGLKYKVSDSRSLYDSLINSDAAPTVVWDTTWPGNQGRVYIYTDDERTENLRLGTAQSVSKRILLSDKTINGQSYITQVYLDKSLFLSEEEQSKGPIVLQVKSVSESYFTYLKGYELFEPSSAYNTLLQPVMVKGGVEGGLGIVGGVYRLEFQFLFDRWYE